MSSLTVSPTAERDAGSNPARERNFSLIRLAVSVMASGLKREIDVMSSISRRIRYIRFRYASVSSYFPLNKKSKHGSLAMIGN